MNIGTSATLRAAMILACLISAPSHADWASSTSARVVRALPANSQIQPQNPPGFTWAMYGTKDTVYELELTRSGDAPKTFTTNRNWFLPSALLSNGTYSWRVRPVNTQTWSSPRGFVIDATSKPFVVPENAELKAAILKRSHPRSIAAGVAPASIWSAAMAAERNSPMLDLMGGVARRTTAVPAYTDADWPQVTAGPLTAAKNSQLSNLRWAMMDVTRQIEASALLWRLTGKAEYKTEAIKRGNQLAALNPYGPTSYENADQETRMIALALVKAVDLLAGDLDAATRAVWLKAVEARTTVIYNAFNTSDGGYDQYPFDSHGAVAQGYLALIAALSLGDIPAASNWFDFSFRAYANSIYPWSGAEGGFANGTSYGQHMALHSLTLWQPLAAATGINLFEKPWSNGFLKLFMHFQPPGSVTHVFGDEHETAPVATELKGYASRFATPEAAWYVKNLVGAEDPLTMLQTPYPLAVASVKVATAPKSAALYPSIGWAAIHSDISDRARTSLYFKSSPYGSYNHSHGDQNSLLLSSGGRPLLIETGWYDWYGSPLSNDWYRQTKAHNAITYDGGKGQALDGYDVQLSRNGKITSFISKPEVEFVEGDATAAYNGALTSAIRKVWYLRQKDAVVVYDKLESATARVFEWNMHAPVLMTVDNKNAVTIKNVDRSVCIRPLTQGLTFVKRVGAASKTGTFEDHAAFTAPLSKSAEFLLLLDVGCKNPAVSLTNTTSGRTLTVGGVPVTLPK